VTIPIFRFTIRDLLWLTVVVAVLIAWLMDRVPMVRELRIRREAENAFNAHQERLKAHVQAIKYRKSPLEQSGTSGGMFGTRPSIDENDRLTKYGPGPWIPGAPGMEGPPGFGPPDSLAP
jgi:hypothetical protein